MMRVPQPRTPALLARTLLLTYQMESRLSALDDIEDLHHMRTEHHPALLFDLRRDLATLRVQVEGLECERALDVVGGSQPVRVLIREMEKMIGRMEEVVRWPRAAAGRHVI
ncbi:hypothetical protein B0A55_08799 [Friedmanniomyces simplex]|uniref:Uncharacterized protein n=1 Tax=Friedmanniomyces simplex TaxID=329884 RepID=A0A4U0WZ22_9PEZI|nr:hypothetical protein B0A55_08799 [Friedmanniomyces simplex]